MTALQRAILANLEAGRRADHARFGLNRPVGIARCIAALQRKGYVTRDGLITPAGCGAIGKSCRP